MINKLKKMQFNAYRRKLAAAGVTVVGSAIAATPAWALDAAQNTQIGDAYTATGVTLGLVIQGLLAAGLILTGFGLIWGLIRR